MTMSGNSIEIKRQLKAGPDRVFAAFADKAAFSRWFKPSPDIELEVIEFEFRKGGCLHLEFGEHGSEKMVMRGEFIQINPISGLSFTWTWDAPHSDSGSLTLVEISIAARGDTTDLTVLHSKLPTAEARTRYLQGWTGCLDLLEGTIKLQTA